MNAEEVLNRLNAVYGQQTEEVQAAVMACLITMEAVKEMCGPVVLGFVIRCVQEPDRN